MILTSDRRTELLGACPLFRGMAAEQLAALAERATEVEFPPRHVIARQGEIGTGFFVIVDGRVRVVRDARTLATLGPGEFFGELSVLDGQPRIAQVVADEPTRCLEAVDVSAPLAAPMTPQMAHKRAMTRKRAWSLASRHTSV